MKVMAVISARGGSKEVPRKNLLPLAGRDPLISYMIRKAAACPFIDKVICSTDSAEIGELARKYGAETPFERPPELATDRVPLISVTQHAMRAMDELGYRADVIVQLAPTSPFIQQEKINQAVEMITRGECECSVSLKRIEHEHPYRARVVDEKGYFRNFITDLPVESFHSRQDLPTLYCTSGGLYARKRELLEKYDGRDFALGKSRKGILLDDIEAINIDRKIDLSFAEFMLNSGKISDSYLAASN